MEKETGVSVSHEAILEDSELLAVLSVLDSNLEGWGGCNDTRAGVRDAFELREGIKKRLGGVVVLMLLMLFVLARLLFLDNRRCSLGERGITTVEADKPSLEKRGVTSYVLIVYQEST